jgi:molecular chaperone DnaJ
MQKRDYYDALGLEKGASIDEVKLAYKRLAKKYHPDISKEPDAEERFKEILEAYQVLSDPQKKENYDRFGHAFEGFHGFQGFRGFDARNFEFDFGELFNSFGSMFGGSFGEAFREAFGGRKAPEKGANIRYDLSISFEEAAFGTEKEISFERVEPCRACNAAGGFGQKSCPACNGHGILRQERRTPFGIFATQSACPRCGGNGKVLEKQCSKCGGKTTVKVQKRLKVKIPRGIDTGNHLRLQGQGNAGKGGGASGDLFVVVFVEPHEVFKRSGADVYAEVPISFSEAVLGAKIGAPTLEGEATITIPPGTQTGTIFRLHGKGIRELGSSKRGDEYVKVVVQTPKKTSGRYRKLVAELAKEEGLAQERKTFFQRLGERFNKS